MTEGRAGTRLKILALLVVFMFVALTTRLWFLQVLASAQAQKEAARNAVRVIETPAPRGRIVDVDGNPLVGNRMSLVLTVNRQEAGDQLEEILFKLSELLGEKATVLAERAEDPRFYAFSPVPVATDVNRRIAFYLGEHQDEFPGVEAVETPVRTYPEKSLAAHVLGYLGQISPEKLKDPAFEGYEPGDLVGVSGVEAVYERDLRGTPGRITYRVDSAGRNLGEIGRREPLPGNDLELSIDGGVQRLAEESLTQGMENARSVFDEGTGEDLRANAGAVVVVDPKTGAIVALASSPTFEPATFVRSLTTEEFQRRFGEGSGFPLLDRALAGQYPPGSTYKPFVALSGLRRGLLSESEYYDCPGSWTVPYNEEDPGAIQYVFDNWTSANLGYMSLAKALSVSCDTVFYPVGYEYWRIYYPPPDADGITGNDAQPPREPFQQDLEATGFGRPTNVDLPGEQDGRVPDAAWKASIHDAYPKLFPDGRWVPGDFVNMSIGQGDTLVTPLQLARAYSALMNGGRLCQPHVLQSVRTPQGKLIRRAKPNCSKKLPFTQPQLTYIRDALAETPRTGTAAPAFVGFPFSRVWLAGKTGTAQVFGKQDYSWFAGMTSAEGREYVIVALVEQGGHGSTTAAPIVRNIIEGLYGIDQSGYGSITGTD